MLVTGIDGVYDIDLADVDYYYVKNQYLIFFRTNGNYTAVEMSGNYVANLSGREYFNENWRNFATILNTDNGRSYYINVANVASHSVSSSSVVVNFSINILTITCKDSASATWDNQYLTDVRAAYNFLADFAGSFKEVGSGKTYATIALANAAASSGDCVRIYAGTYAETLTVKNGVYYYFEGTDSILVGKITYPDDNAWTSYIYGYGTFRQSGSTSSDHIWQGSIYADDLTVNSKLVLVFDKIETNAPRTIFAGTGKTRLMLKGRACEAYTEASYVSFLDTDIDVNADFDIVSIIECTELSFVTFIHYAGGRKIVFRNLSCVTNANIPQINASYSYESELTNYQYWLVNVHMDNQYNVTYGANYSDYVGGDTALPHDVNIGNSIFQAASGEKNFYSHFGSAFTLYGFSYATYGGNTLITYSQPPSMIIDSGLTLLESDNPATNITLNLMALTNKPEVSKYQVGHLVCTKDTVGGADSNDVSLAPHGWQVKVTRVRTVMSNPNNDADGVQQNFYTLEGYDQEYPESEVFWSPQHYFFSLLPDGQYVNRHPFTEMGLLGIRLFNVSLGGANSYAVYDFSGMNFDLGDVTAGGGTTLNWLKTSGGQTAIVDGMNLANATVPAVIDTEAKLRAQAYSYDPVTTIYTDGLPIGDS